MQNHKDVSPPFGDSFRVWHSSAVMLHSVVLRGESQKLPVYPNFGALDGGSTL